MNPHRLSKKKAKKLARLIAYHCLRTFLIEGEEVEGVLHPDDILYLHQELENLSLRLLTLDQWLASALSAQGIEYLIAQSVKMELL